MFRTMLLSKIFNKLSSKRLTSVKAGGGAAPVPPGTPGHQQWANYPESPVLTENFPYQVIIQDTLNDNLRYALYACTVPLRHLDLTTKYYISPLSSAMIAQITLVGDAWDPNIYYNTSHRLYGAFSYLEANADVFLDDEQTTVYFEKTTA